jgi:hypothetical protein
MSWPSMPGCARPETHKTRHQLGDARLARAGVPDQRHALAGADVQAEIAQHLLLSRCSENHVLEADVAAQVARRFAGAGRRRLASISPKMRSVALSAL